MPKSAISFLIASLLSFPGFCVVMKTLLDGWTPRYFSLMTAGKYTLQEVLGKTITPKELQLKGM